MGYPEWADELKNALVQLRPGSRAYLTELERLPLRKPEPAISEIKDVFNKHSLAMGISYEVFKADMFVVKEKTTGEARERV